MTEVSTVLLALVRLGIHPDAEVVPLPADVDWPSVFALAKEQGVPAIAWDGYARLYKEGLVPVDMDKVTKKQWVGSLLMMAEQKYPRYRSIIGRLASFYEKQGIRMMVLKGYGLSLNYPEPAHRPCGDVDIWNYGEYKRADRAMEKELGIEIDRSHHHHTTFKYKGQFFENHYDFVNIHSHPSNKVVELRLKELAFKDEEAVDIDGQRVYLPSPEFNALFLARHTASHFAAERMSIRQLLDWGTFVQKYHDRVDWESLESFIDTVGMTPFYQILNGICVDYLGFPANLFPAGRHLEEKRVMEDILSPEFLEASPDGLFAQWLWRYRRWAQGAWKHCLVYPESMLLTFFVQLTSHLMKPKSLKL